MEYLARRNRRSFMMAAVGAGSATFASWASPLPAELSCVPTSRSDGFHRLPKNDEPMVLSGRAISFDQKPLNGQWIVLKNGAEKTLTDADGRFFFKTTTSALIHSEFELTVKASNQENVRRSSANYQISSQQLTQDAVGEWRIYVDIRI